MKKLIILFVIALSFTSVSFGQTCNELKTLIDSTYGFKPSKLTDAQIISKYNELDKVWNMVGENPKILLPCLTAEIKERKEDSFFAFNASNLLFKYDQSIDTKKLMIGTYSGADLADINLQYWLPYMAGFGLEGLDVTEVGKTWLRFPNPRYYLPQHGTRPVDKSIGALAIFGSMDESIATPELEKLVSEESLEIKSIAIWLLVKQATSSSDLAVSRLATKFPSPLSERLIKDVTVPKMIEPRVGKAKTTRDQYIKAFNELLEGKPDSWISLTVDVPDGERDIVVVFGEEDLPLLRKVRRSYAANATPHSIEWYESFTQIINTLRFKTKEKEKSK